ncbi:MAG: multidrug resistance transporter, Bcr family [Gammaproteobacteria bacterium]|nr:multidrug resistance transporter, Bcr family [Gammaproteobacteria bacterium]
MAKTKKDYSATVMISFILLVGCLSNIASDIYAPSILAISIALDTPIRHVQVSMALYMLGMTLSLFIYGPLSDGMGRKWPLMAGLSIAFTGTLLCVFAPNIHLLLWGRFIQGCGIGAGAGLWRSIFRDVFTGDELAKYSSYLTIILIFVIPLSPTVGGYLQQYFGWRSVFIFLLLYIAISLWVIGVYYRETSRHHHRQRLKIAFIASAFKELLTSRLFMGYVIAVLLTFGGIFSWYTVGPVLLIRELHITPVAFGWLNLVVAASAMSIGGITNARLVKHYGGRKLIQIGWGISLLGGFLLLLSQADWGITTTGILISAFLFALGSTFVWPNSFAGALTPFGHIAGYAGSVYSGLQLGGGALMSGIASHTSAHSQYPLGMIYTGCALLAWTAYHFLVKPVIAKTPPQ